ncbi:DUF4783 domain-containing protein [bacterium]|nr:DUF4783 domain-containing protein [candidate division CSSED10-310 bacterium]
MVRAGWNRWYAVILMGIAGWFSVGICAQESAIPPGLQQAFQSGQVDGLAGLLPDQGRIHLAIPVLGINPGTYSKDQAMALLRNLFRRYRPISFTAEANPGAVKGQWVVAEASSGRRHRVAVYISLEERSRRAIITSIRGG